MRRVRATVHAWVLAIACGATPAITAPAAAAEPAVLTIKLSFSNVHLIRGERPVLVDAGGKADIDALGKALDAHGVAWRDIGALILTHGHSDHAGGAAEVRRRSGAPILIGAGDVPMAAAGRNDELQPTSLLAAALKRFAIDPAYPPFAPDVVVVPGAPFELSRMGIAGRVVQMPGHTPGSLVVLLDDGRSFAGDLVLGGWFGGKLFAGRAGEHYFHADRVANRANIVELLRGPTHTFFLGHGGPVTRDSVLRGFELDDPRQPPSR